MSLVARETFNNVSISIFDKSEQLCIPAVQVATALGYKKPREAVVNIITRNIHEFQGLFLSPNLGVDYKTSNDVFLTEQGVYLFCMLSRTEKASQFRRWVSQILQIYRKNEQSFSTIVSKNTPIEALEVLNQQLALVIQAFKDHEETIRQQNFKIEALEKMTRASYIDRRQRYQITRRVKLLAQAKAEAENRPIKSIFPEIYNVFYKLFQISSYQDLPKTQYYNAIETLDEWLRDYGVIPPYDA